MAAWSIADLEMWDKRIFEKAKEFGLGCYEQEFEICDHHEMLGYMAYSGMPSRYPHWSYGKAYEKTKTLYDHGVSGLPYEMVINSNPALAYLMRDNTLCLQILTIAHVYGHNDFFKNNFRFRSTRAENTISTMKAHADIVRRLVEDPSIGLEKVEKVLDAAHALSLQCRRNLGVKKLSVEEERKRLIDAARPREDPFWKLHKREDYKEPDLFKIPPSPEEDLLLFIAAYNPFLEDWERVLLQIVHEEAQYFIPQIETKIMNEGWASYWHREILNALELPQELHLEFLVRHNQVVRPHEGGLNPYHIGLKLWEDIRHRYDEAKNGTLCEFHGIHHGKEIEEEGGTPGVSGIEKMFEARAADRDQSFLRRFLNERMVRDLDLFEYAPKGEDYVVSEVADTDGWRSVKKTLLRNVGMNSVPVIKVVDADFSGNRILRLRHDHDGRDLHLEYAAKTLGFLRQLWSRAIVLETAIDGKKIEMKYGSKGLNI